MKKDNWNTMKGKEIPNHPGDYRKVFSGDKIMLALNDVTPPSEPLTTTPKLHNHPNEQINYFLKGEGTMFVGDVSFKVEAGTVVHVPAGVMHGLNPSGSEKILLLEMFSPIREEFLS